MPETPRRVVLVDCQVLAPHFRGAGCEVLCLNPETPIVELRPELDRAGFLPDLVFQREKLAGARVLIGDLPDLECLRVFWSQDTHLNAFWQTWYARLFDGVLITQPDWLKTFEAAGAPRTSVLTWFGARRDFIPHARRRHHLGFVGRIGPERPKRQWLIEFLTRFDSFRLETDIPPQTVGEAYADCRLAPNESIMAEVNMRLFEAASSGCLVLAQDLGEAQDRFLAPGRQAAVYSHVAELAQLIDYYRERPEEAEALGRAAHERVQREHLPEHRVAEALSFAATLPRAGATGDEAKACFRLAACQLICAGRSQADPAQVLRTLAAFPADPEAWAGRLALLRLLGRKERLGELLAEELVQGGLDGSLSADLAGSVAGLYLGDFPAAKHFWYRHCKASGTGPEKPGSPAHLYLLWSKELRRAGRMLRKGLAFDEERHLPQSALECLLMAERLLPDDLEAARRIENLLGRVSGAEHMRLAYRAHISLHRPDDWRASLGLALDNLRCYRLEPGMQELALARSTAEAAGELESFLRVLAREDPRGLLEANLS